jgi:hypothetical protein
MNIRSALSKTTRITTSTLAIALLAAGMASSPSRSHAAAPPDPVRSWNGLALQTVRAKSASDAQAARLYAMVNVAMYDAVNGIIVRTEDEGRASALVLPTGIAKGDQSAAAAAAAHAVLAGEYPDLKASMYDPQLASDLAALGKGGKITSGQAWGAYVGGKVRDARASDGSTPNETQPAGSGPGQFRAAWSGVQFRNLAPFAIADSSVYVGHGPPALTSLDYAGAFAEIKIIGNAANADSGKLATFQYWSLGGGTSQPPGAWVQVAVGVVAGNSLPEQCRLLALVSMAMADTVAPTFMSKFVYRHWRPATAIREADTDGNSLTDPDPSWNPRAGGIGTSPEYWSGHSSFSAAAAATLAGFFCADNISFTLTTDSATTFGLPARSYPSFSAAANEAGLSRVVGGIHFRFSNEEGLAAGRAIAREILANKLLRRHGPTHFGECPL